VSFPRPAMDTEQIISELRGRIDEDIRKNIFPQGHQIPDRYLYHLRELWKEDNAAHALIQLQSTGTDSGEKIDTSATFGSVSQIGAPDQQPDFPRLGAWGLDSRASRCIKILRWQFNQLGHFTRQDHLLPK
jgi:hypothetical protein